MRSLNIQQDDFTDIQCHGWRYAHATQTLHQDFTEFSDTVFGAGDWCPSINDRPPQETELNEPLDPATPSSSISRN